MPKITQARALILLGIGSQRLDRIIDKGELKFEQRGRHKFYDQSEIYRVAKKLAEEYKVKMNREL